MKIRTGFVSNSSSSSFICVKAGDTTLYGDDTEIPNFETDFISFDIDALIKNLEDAKAKGVKSVGITYGGGYDG